MNSIRLTRKLICSDYLKKTSSQVALKKSFRYNKADFERFVRLYRINNPNGFWLIFIPTFGGLSLASDSVLPKPGNAMLFALGSFAARSTGCVINDLADRKFDSKVERTKNRPIASGEITIPHVALLGSSAVSALILSRLNKYTIFLGIPSIFLMAAYPFMKRITHYPQLFLGFAFNWGILLAWTSVFGCINPYRNSWLCIISYYLSSVCWTVHYDTIYAHQDKLFDKKIGIYSTALRWNKLTRKRLFTNAMISGVLASATGKFANFGLEYQISVLMYTAHLIYQSKTTNFLSEQDCMNQFIMSKYSGIILLLGITFSKYRAKNRHSDKHGTKILLKD
ncbi:putative UbiA prenyltransferase family member (3I27) [Cryptosporidium canis]|uniref:4-hydroxybenzoate polyprenyltransferase, mitochondrial n=1 Tax=Cryptosporidium canis TaxID=195482 RepID=A0A9D5DFR8_9CRYT|nr:putative UbiA prenyltransferase family member (3I27) [Cryptosporidium canis]